MVFSLAFLQDTAWSTLVVCMVLGSGTKRVVSALPVGGHLAVAVVCTGVSLSLYNILGGTPPLQRKIKLTPGDMFSSQLPMRLSAFFLSVNLGFGGFVQYHYFTSDRR